MTEGTGSGGIFSYTFGIDGGGFYNYQEYLNETEFVFSDVTDQPDSEIDTDKTDSDDEGTLQVQVLLDASGSMAAKVDGGVKMDLAKEAITDFAGVLSEDAQISLRVYGHAGTNKKDGKEKSCSTTEAVYPMDQFDPTGYTPIGLAIEKAAADLQKKSDDNTKKCDVCR